MLIPSASNNNMTESPVASNSKGTEGRLKLCVVDRTTGDSILMILWLVESTITQYAYVEGENRVTLTCSVSVTKIGKYYRKQEDCDYNVTMSQHKYFIIAY